MAKRKVVAEELKAPAVKGLLRDVPDPTVYLNGVLRFDDDHIIRVKYDPTSKAMVIDDVPQSLESSITLGEGGGGGYKNPILNIVFVNPLEIDTTAEVYYHLTDSGLVEYIELTLPAEETKTYKAIVIPENDGNGNLTYSIGNAFAASDATASNLVNIDESGNVIDITAESSITITFDSQN